MKKASRFIFFLLLLSNSCNLSLTKEAYLENYANFIESVKKNYSTYDEKKWKEQDKEFARYNEELFQQFKDRLNPIEQTRIMRFAFVYNLVRGNITLADLASGKYNQTISDYLTELTSVLSEVTLLKKDIKDVISLDLLNKLLTVKKSVPNKN